MHVHIQNAIIQHIARFFGISQNLDLITVFFSEESLFEFFDRGERGNDDTLSILLHNSTTWCHMMAILPSFDSQRNRPSTNTPFLYYG